MSAELSPNGRKAWSQIVAKAWADQAFRKRLLADPAGVLKEHGMQVPPGVQVRVVENTESIQHLVLPKQQSEELSEAELEQVAAGRGIVLTCIPDLRAR